MNLLVYEAEFHDFNVSYSKFLVCHQAGAKKSEGVPRKLVKGERTLFGLQVEIEEYSKELERFYAALKEMPDKVSIIGVY